MRKSTNPAMAGISETDLPRESFGLPKIPPGQDDKIKVQKGQADARPPVNGVRWPVAHAEMQFHRRELLAAKTSRKVWLQAA